MPVEIPIDEFEPKAGRVPRRRRVVPDPDPVPVRALPARILEKIGRQTDSFLRQAGEVSLISWTSIHALFTGRLSFRQVLREMYWMGVQSMPIITVTGILSGIVTSQQGGYQFTGNVPLYILGSVVTSSIVLELGPVLTAVVFIGRVGARITAELGTMKVSEQIDALYSLGRDPVRQLIAPRLYAGLLVLPMLVAYANLIGIIAGMLTAQATLGLGRETFLYGVRIYWHSFDLFYSVGKGAVFGLIIPLVAAHMGLRTHGGAEGVGRATTAAVVYMIMAVLVLDATFPMIFLR
jgi:phospholipid/cholesterol/gamma-HCH transport system permease protein